MMDGVCAVPTYVRLYFELNVAVVSRITKVGHFCHQMFVDLRYTRPRDGSRYRRAMPHQGLEDHPALASPSGLGAGVGPSGGFSPNSSTPIYHSFAAFFLNHDFTFYSDMPHW